MRVEEAFEQAQEAALLASAELLQGLGRAAVFAGAPPTGEKLPYVIFEKPQVIDDTTECLDGWEVFGVTTLFAKRGPQPASPAALAGICREVLRADLGLAGFRTVDFQFVDARASSQPDGVTRYVITHRYLIEPAT